MPVAVAAILVAAEHRHLAGPKRGRALAAIIIGSIVAALDIAASLVG